MSPAYPIVAIMGLVMLCLGWLGSGWGWYVAGTLFIVMPLLSFGGQTENSPDQPRPEMTNEEYQRARSEFDYFESKRKQDRAAYIDSHDVYDRQQDYMRKARKIVGAARNWNAFVGPPGSLDRVDGAPPRFGVNGRWLDPIEGLTEDEWKQVEKYAKKAAKRDQKDEGPLPRDKDGYRR